MLHSLAFRHTRPLMALTATFILGGCGQLSSLLHSDLPPAPVETAVPVTEAATRPASASAPVAPVSAPHEASLQAPTATAPASAPVIAAAPASTVTATALPPAADSPAAKSSAPPSTTSTATAASGDNAKPYYVHIGAFAVPANASNAYQKVQATGIMVSTQEVDTPKGRLTRVRAGPFLTRADADVAAKRIHELELDAVILRDPSSH